MSVEHLKSMCPPATVAHLDSMGFDWSKWLPMFEQIIAIILANLPKP